MFTRNSCALILFIFISHSYVSGQQKLNKETRNYKWEAGLNFGHAAIKGDVRSLMPTPGWGVYVNRSFAEWFSLQAYYSGGIVIGMNFVPSYNFGKNTAWKSKYNGPVIIQQNGILFLVNSADGKSYPVNQANADIVYYNYRTAFNQLSLLSRFAVTIKSIKPQIGFYLLLGAGGMSYRSKVDALDANGLTYEPLFRSVYNNFGASRGKAKEILTDLFAGMDRVYETDAETNGKQGGINPVIQGGFGISFKLSERIKIGIEHLISTTNERLLDGQQWQEVPVGDAELTKKFDRLHFTSIGLSCSF